MRHVPATTRSPARAFILALVTAAAAAPASAQVAAPPAPAVTPAQVDAVFSDVDGDALPGCAVGVGRDGRSVLERAYGMADLEHDVANAPETVFEAGSVSKQATAAVVVLLALDGTLALDDDVRRWVPEVPDYGVPITLRHLLNHTSGLRDWGSVAGLEGWPRTTRVHTHEHVLDIVARQRALNYPPGDHYSYTNTGYNLLVMVAERASGVPFRELSRTRVFEPLGMRRTEWRDDYTRIVADRAVAYRRRDGAYHLDMPFENVFGNGGLLTTVGDLLRFTWNLESGALGGPRFVAEMHRQAVLNDGRTIAYASGLSVGERRGLRQVSHSGATAGYRAFLTRYPERGLAVAVLCNAAFANPTALAQRVADLYLGDALATNGPVDAVEPPARALDPAVLASRAGLYRSARTHAPLRLVVRAGALVVDGGRPQVLAAISEDRFRAGRSVYAFAPSPSGGGRRAFVLHAPDGDTVRYLPVQAFAPSSAELEAFAGRWRSDEAEVTWTTAVEDGGLVLRERYGEATPLRPVYTDVFQIGGAGLFRFLRDGSGRVSELSVVSSRVWDLRFRRLP